MLCALFSSAIFASEIILWKWKSKNSRFCLFCAVCFFFWIKFALFTLGWRRPEKKNSTQIRMNGRRKKLCLFTFMFFFSLFHFASTRTHTNTHFFRRLFFSRDFSVCNDVRFNSVVCLWRQSNVVYVVWAAFILCPFVWLFLGLFSSILCWFSRCYFYAQISFLSRLLRWFFLLLFSA